MFITSIYHRHSETKDLPLHKNIVQPLAWLFSASVREVNVFTPRVAS